MTSSARLDSLTNITQSHHRSIPPHKAARAMARAQASAASCDTSRQHTARRDGTRKGAAHGGRGQGVTQIRLSHPGKKSEDRTRRGNGVPWCSYTSRGGLSSFPHKTTPSFHRRSTLTTMIDLRLQRPVVLLHRPNRLQPARAVQAGALAG